jgi:hypothetical protein
MCNPHKMGEVNGGEHSDWDIEDLFPDYIEAEPLDMSARDVDDNLVHTVVGAHDGGAKAKERVNHLRSRRLKREAEEAQGPEVDEVGFLDDGEFDFVRARNVKSMNAKQLLEELIVNAKLPTAKALKRDLKELALNMYESMAISLMLYRKINKYVDAPTPAATLRTVMDALLHVNDLHRANPNRREANVEDFLGTEKANPKKAKAIAATQNNQVMKASILDSFKELNKNKKRHMDMTKTGTMCARVRVLVKSSGMEGLWYGYEVGSESKAWNTVQQDADLILTLEAFHIAQRGALSPHDKAEDKRRIHSIFLKLGSQERARARVRDDSMLWEELKTILQKDDPDLYENLSDVDSALMAVKITYLSSKEKDPRFIPFKWRPIKDTDGRKYCDHPFSVYTFDCEADSWGNLFKSKSKFVECFDYPIKNACMLKLILQHYKKSFETEYGDPKKHRNPLSRKLTPEFVVQLCCGRSYDPSVDTAMTPEQAETFFRTYRLGLVIVDPHRNIVYEYHPPDGKYNSNVQPSVAQVVYWDNHVEEITEIRSFERTWGGHDPLSKYKPPGSKFVLPSFERGRETKYELANSPDDVLQICKKWSRCITKESEFKRVHIIYNNSTLFGDLTYLFHFILRHGCKPKIVTQSRTCLRCIMFSNVESSTDGCRMHVCITNACDTKFFKDVRIDSVEQYQRYETENSAFQKLLLSKRYLSRFSERTQTAFDNYFISVNTGSVDGIDPLKLPWTAGQIRALDFNKFYAYCLASCPWIPSISPFEEFIEYKEGLPVCSNRLYLVGVHEEMLSSVGLNQMFFAIYGTRDATLMYGFELLRLLDIFSKEGKPPSTYIKIHYQIEIITHPIDPVRKGIVRLLVGAELMDIDVDLRKAIPNTAIGMAGKRFNKKCIVDVHQCKDDANAYMCSHDNRPSMFELITGSGVWVTCLKIKTELEESFRPINLMVKSMARIELFEKAMIMQADGLKPFAFKTDCLYFQDNGNPQLIGLEIAKYVSPRMGDLKFVETPKKIPEKPLVREKREWRGSSGNVLRVDLGGCGFEHENRVICMGRPGCGKTHKVVNLCIAKFGKHEVLVVGSYNAICANIRHKFFVEAVTWNVCRGEGINDQKSKKKPFDLLRVGKDGKPNPFKAIVIEEIMLFNHHQLIKLRAFMDEHADIIFFATGDGHQLEAIDDVIDFRLKVKYVTHPTMFPYVWTAKDNHRVHCKDPKHQEHFSEGCAACLDERKKMDALYDDILECHQSHHEPYALLRQALKKHLPPHNFICSMEDFRTWIAKLASERKQPAGVSYYGVSADTTNREINTLYKPSNNRQKTLVNNITYTLDGDLICKKFLEIEEEKKLHVNCRYRIEKMNDQFFTLKDRLTMEEFEVNHDQVIRCFSLPYCNTVHSSQGACIPKDFFIADFNRDREINWLYTAISRATSVSAIYILDFSLYDFNIVERFSEMIRRYKAQDRLAGRTWNEGTYYDVEYIHQAYKNTVNGGCPKCGEHMSLFDRGNPRGFTMDRPHNSEAHIKGNGVACCKKCNSIMGGGEQRWRTGGLQEASRGEARKQ